MAGFNPYETQTLSSLLTALRAGLDPTYAASQLTNLIAQQQARVQQRKDEMASLANQLLGLAQSGQPLEGAQAYLSALREAGVLGPKQMQRAEDVAAAAYGAEPARFEPGPASTYRGLEDVATMGDVIQGGLPLSALAEAQPGRISPLAPAPPAQTLDAEDQAQLWSDIVQNLRVGKSPQGTWQALQVRYGPLLAGHEAEVLTMIAQALSVLGQEAPANERAQEQGRGFPFLSALGLG